MLLLLLLLMIFHHGHQCVNGPRDRHGFPRRVVRPLLAVRVAGPLVLDVPKRGPEQCLDGAPVLLGSAKSSMGSAGGGPAFRAGLPLLAPPSSDVGLHISGQSSGNAQASVFRCVWRFRVGAWGGALSETCVSWRGGVPGPRQRSGSGAWSWWRARACAAWAGGVSGRRSRLERARAPRVLRVGASSDQYPAVARVAFWAQSAVALLHWRWAQGGWAVRRRRLSPKRCSPSSRRSSAGRSLGCIWRAGSWPGWCGWARLLGDCCGSARNPAGERGP